LRRIVITGATSFIGLHLLHEWLKEECEIFAVVRKNCQKLHLLPQDEKLHTIALNMEEYDQLPDYIEKADDFYHLAWEGTRGSARNDIDLQQHNYVCTLKAFHAAKQLGCSFFLGSGSQAEYGKMSESIHEESPCHPLTEYGKQKLRICQELQTLAKENSIRFIWTRIFSLYGVGDSPQTLVSSCIEKMSKNEAIFLTECSQIWDFLYVSDAVQAMKQFALMPCASGVYNLASGDIRPLREYICEMKEILSSSSELNFGAVPYSPEGVVNLVPDIHKLLQTGWKPQTSFRDGIMKICHQSAIS